MKKLFLTLMVVVMSVAFAGMAFAVGHVDQETTVVVEFTSPTEDDIVVEGDATIAVTAVTKDEVETALPNFSFVGLPDDKTYEMTVYNAVILDVTDYVAPLVLDFTAVGGNWTGVMLERNEGDVFDYFPKDEEGLITIENPADYFDAATIAAAAEEGTGVLFVELKEESTPSGGGGGGGCSLGMLSPLALLLAVPLVLLRK